LDSYPAPVTVLLVPGRTFCRRFERKRAFSRPCARAHLLQLHARRLRVAAPCELWGRWFRNRCNCRDATRLQCSAAVRASWCWLQVQTQSCASASGDSTFFQTCDSCDGGIFRRCCGCLDRALVWILLVLRVNHLADV